MKLRTILMHDAGPGPVLPYGQSKEKIIRCVQHYIIMAVDASKHTNSVVEPEGAKTFGCSQSRNKVSVPGSCSWLWLQVRHKRPYLNFYLQREQYMKKISIAQMTNLQKYVRFLD